MNYSNYKIILLGDSSVGKSSLVERYINNDFAKNFTTTVGVDYRLKIIHDKKIKLSFWDTAGQERFNEIIKAYYRNCNCYLILFDISNQESFLHVEKWLDSIKKYSNNENPFIILIGTKTDLSNNRAVKNNDIEIFIFRNKLEYYEISAKNNDNIDILFNHIIESLIEKYKKPEETISYRKKLSSLLLSKKDDNKEKSQNKNCC
jgi:small GTP-binding protein